MKKTLAMLAIISFPILVWGQAKVLFLGTINGIPERDFVERIVKGYFRDTYAKEEIVLTSYLEAPEGLQALTDEGYGVLEGVDATALHEDKRFKGGGFDYVVWIGPTNDDDLSQTAGLVEAFVKSGREILSDKGKVLVVQSMDTPNFRGIYSIKEPLQYLGRVTLEGRLQTKLKSMEKRVDDVFVSPSHAAYIGKEGNFVGVATRKIIVDGLDTICSVPAKNWPKHGLSKKGIVDTILEYASILPHLEK